PLIAAQVQARQQGQPPPGFGHAGKEFGAGAVIYPMDQALAEPAAVGQEPDPHPGARSGQDQHRRPDPAAPQGSIRNQGDASCTILPENERRPSRRCERAAFQQLVEVEGSRTPRPRRDQPGFYERSPCSAFAVRRPQGPVRRRLTRWVLAPAARVTATASLLELTPE